MRNVVVDRLEIEPLMEQVMSPCTKVAFSAMAEMKIPVPGGVFVMERVETSLLHSDMSLHNRRATTLPIYSR
jgi:hypothetical protein